MNIPTEFDCIDCGVHVVAAFSRLVHDQNICLECLWLRMIEDPVEREKLRQYLKEGYPK